MVSQHPDHANKPYWHDNEFISTNNESVECFLSYSDLGVSEYKWDWEGKLVDESVLERLLSEHFDYFKKNQIGRDIFLTFRLPNPKVETEFRLGRAFMGILSAAQLAKQVGLHFPPLFEVILPMTGSAEEMIEIQEAFAEIAQLKHKLYNFKNGSLKHIEVIPLFEQVEKVIDSDKILNNYVRLHEKKFGFTPSYIRPYVARSDPALNSGIVPTILAIKIALSRYLEFSRKTGIELYPIIGTGSLPFRGGLNPKTVNDFLEEYKGIRTALLQSAFRYDYGMDEVKRAIAKLENKLPEAEALSITKTKEKNLRNVIAAFETFYRKTIEGVAPLVNEVATLLPKRRERVQHIGLFGYSRGVGKVRLPRAIGFTGALYSLGIPPELIGTGRGLREARKVGVLSEVEKYYQGLRGDMIRAGAFLNKSVLMKLAKQNSSWGEILEDVRHVENFLGKDLLPRNIDEMAHGKLSETIFEKVKSGESSISEIAEAAALRKSLG